MNSNPLLKAGLAYEKLGWSVIPVAWIDEKENCGCGNAGCSSPGKHPLVRWKRNQEIAVSSALIEDWWSKWPRANVGIVTGSVSKLVVVDIDPDRGADPRRLRRDLKPMATVKTGSGGYHFYFSGPADGSFVANRVGDDGIDVRGEGGFVVAPPSRHKSGATYKWLRGSHRSELSPFSDDLLDGTEDTRVLSGERWVSAAIRGVDKGERNNTCAKLAGYFLNKGLPKDVVVGWLRIWDGQNRPPLGTTEIERTVESVSRTRARRQPGPDMSDFDESTKKRLGREATDVDRQNRREYWQFQKLHWVREHLEGERRASYAELLAKHGEPELADMNYHVSSGSWGNVSPMTVEDLAKLTFEEAVGKVSSWEPAEGRFMGPDIEGLASTFGEYVGTNPKAFSTQAGALLGRPAIYVRGFLSQMAEAIKGDREIDVSAVLELCRWVLERPLEERTTPEQGHEVLVDKDWQWTRDQISQFVKNICEAKANDAPTYPLEGLREPIWQVLSALSRDRVESYIVHDISEDDPRIHDYLTLGLNSPRGKAVEAALEYARWIANHIKTVDGTHEVIPGGFEAIPEVWGLLESQIDPDNRNVESLAVIGSYIGLIYWIDRSWLAANAGRLFHLGGIDESPPLAEGWAAWNAFLVWVRPHIEFYSIFKEQFAYAVAQSAQVNLPDQSREQPMNHLGEHLMILYGRGQLGFDDDKGLLKRFLADANPDIRRHAIDSVGRNLYGEELPEEVVARFKALWDVYWAGEGKHDAEQKPDAWLFGMWFSSRQLPEQWALEQLEGFVEITPTPEPDHAIAEQLAKVASVDIVRAVRVLDRMVRGDQEGWRILGWLDSARHILEVAMRAGGDARTHAEQIIDYLGRRGHAGFGELLDLGRVTDPV